MFFFHILLILLKVAVFWVVALCSLVEIYNISDVLAASIIGAMMMMEAVGTSEISVNFCQTTC
jgi:hypothetical protein